MAKNVFDKLGINFSIYINNRKLLNEVLDENRIKEKDKVIKEIDKLDKIPEQEIKKNLKKYQAEKLLSIFKKPESYFKKYPSYKEIEGLKKLCNNYGIKLYFSPSLARGLSYYNGTIFEVKTKKFKETVCSGGSYLINAIQSTGTSVGIERLLNISNIKVQDKTIVIVSINRDKEAINLAKTIRKNAIPCLIFYGRPTKALEYANSKNLRYAVFIGDDEVKAKKLTLKDLKTGKESKLSYIKLIKRLVK